MKEVSYYPGCSLHGTAREYDDSIRGVSRLLGIQLEELDDWTCCGASSAHCTSEELAIELAARNLAIAEKSNRELLVPCVPCYSRFKAVETELKEHSKKIRFAYQGNVPIRYSLDFFCDESAGIIRRSAGTSVPATPGFIGRFDVTASDRPLFFAGVASTARRIMSRMCDFARDHHHDDAGTSGSTTPQAFGFLVDVPEIRELIAETRRLTQAIPYTAARVEALKPAFSKLLAAEGWLPVAYASPDTTSGMGGGSDNTPCIGRRISGCSRS